MKKKPRKKIVAVKIIETPRIEEVEYSSTFYMVIIVILACAFIAWGYYGSEVREIDALTDRTEALAMFYKPNFFAATTRP